MNISIDRVILSTCYFLLNIYHGRLREMPRDYAPEARMKIFNLNPFLLDDNRLAQRIHKEFYEGNICSDQEADKTFPGIDQKTDNIPRNMKNFAIHVRVIGKSFVLDGPYPYADLGDKDKYDDFIKGINHIQRMWGSDVYNQRDHAVIRILNDSDEENDWDFNASALLDLNKEQLGHMNKIGRAISSIRTCIDENQSKTTFMSFFDKYRNLPSQMPKSPLHSPFFSGFFQSVGKKQTVPQPPVVDPIEPKKSCSSELLTFMPYMPL